MSDQKHRRKWNIFVSYFIIAIKTMLHQEQLNICYLIDDFQFDKCLLTKFVILRGIWQIEYVELLSVNYQITH